LISMDGWAHSVDLRSKKRGEEAI